MVNTTGIEVLNPAVGDRDHIRGLNLKNVTLVEYGDYECPYSRQAFQVIETILSRINNNMRFVYRHFPLREIHPHAQAAAQAAEAAALQGEFWSMHAQLYHYHSLADADLRRYANIIGISAERFEHDLTNPTSITRVNEDYQSGLNSGVKGTPTFFINGKLYNGSWEFASLFSAVQASFST